MWLQSHIAETKASERIIVLTASLSETFMLPAEGTFTNTK